jgi:imidazolonepropionase-like amidohydrolase
MLIGAALRLWRQPGATTASRLHAAAAATAGAVLAWTFLFVWTPTGWRSSDRGIDRLAKRVHDAGIPVQSTLIVYETFSPAARHALLQDPAVDALRADTREIWRRGAASGPPGAHLGEFMRKLGRALHREGVTLIAGTDAMGIPLVPPGSSLHRELHLLTESGLTRYEAIRSATVVPAISLRKDHEFGTIAVGKRADLLLVDGNPLDNLDALKQPAGVMSRGQWHSRDELSQLVARMAH